MKRAAGSASRSGPSSRGSATPVPSQKLGLLAPGSHIPVVAEDVLLRKRPDYTLLLAWNYADDIVRRLHAYLESGGRFIHPIPVARVISA